MSGRPLGPGVAPVVTADGVGSVVAIPAGSREMWVHASAAAWISLRNSGSADASVGAGDSQAIAAGTLYGPWAIMRGYDTHVVVAGNGGASTVTLTFTV